MAFKKVNRYYRFTEYNLQAGETWNFYILDTPYNIKALTAIKDLIRGDSLRYSLNMNQDFTESEVTVLIRNSSKSGVKPEHQKVTKVKWPLDIKDLFNGGIGGERRND